MTCVPQTELRTVGDEKIWTALAWNDGLASFGSGVASKVHWPPALPGSSFFLWFAAAD